jgi:hypothetical protein
VRRIRQLAAASTEHVRVDGVQFVLPGRRQQGHKERGNVPWTCRAVLVDAAAARLGAVRGEAGAGRRRARVGVGGGGGGGVRRGGSVSMNSAAYLGGVGFEASLYSRLLPAGASSLLLSYHDLSFPFLLIHLKHRRRSLSRR